MIFSAAKGGGGDASPELAALEQRQAAAVERRRQQLGVRGAGHLCATRLRHRTGELASCVEVFLCCVVLIV